MNGRRLGGVEDRAVLVEGGGREDGLSLGFADVNCRLQDGQAHGSTEECRELDSISWDKAQWKGLEKECAYVGAESVCCKAGINTAL